MIKSRLANFAASSAEIARSRQKRRSVVVALSCAAVIVAGTLYGAGLKTQMEQGKAAKDAYEVSVEEQIAMFQSRRAALVRQREALEGKWNEVVASMEAEKRREGKSAQWSRHRPDRPS